MLVAITGVIDDGARPSDPSFALDQRRALTIQQGEDVTVRIKLVNRAGDEVRLTAGQYLVLIARSLPTPHSRKLFQKNGAHTAGQPPNVYDIVIAAADTRPLAITRGIYDVWCKQAANRVVIPTSELIINRSTADVSSL